MTVLAEHGSGSGSVESVGNVGTVLIESSQAKGPGPLEQNAGQNARAGDGARWEDGEWRIRDDWRGGEVT